jgi:cytochrome c
VRSRSSGARIGWLGGLTLVLGAAIASLAIGAAPPAQAPPDSEFEKVTLNDTPGEPMDLAVLPDGRVLHTTRPGELWLHDPETGLNTLAAEFDVYEHDEEGLQSIALDPNFKKTERIYVYYSPPLDTPVDDPATAENEGDAPEFGTEEDWERFRGVIRLSTFKWKKDELKMNSEQHVMDVPVDRGVCCHVGGDIVFDSDENLILSTGDDTNPFESDGYAPIDERPDRNPAYDAQRTAANTNDLRGKILRITPNARKGGYEIPKGNLFEEGTEGTRPEIYAMGFRNPFRIEINSENDEIYVGDYSPDNPEADPMRGPAGHGKWTILREPGNYGWPYCATAELPYVDYDFETEESGAVFDCANPVNESPHNTGLTELPPVVQPDVWYSFGPSAEFPELGEGGIGPMAGPAYDFERRHGHKRGKGKHPHHGGGQGLAWPEYFDGVPLFYEWTRDYIKEFRLNDDGEVAEINPVLDGVGPANGDEVTLDNGMDMEFGRDGALYTLEYGDGFFSENPDAQLARIDYIGPDGNHAPRVEVAAEPDSAFEPPLTVQFSSEGTTDPDGDEISYEWRLQGKKKVDSRDPNPEFTYKKEGIYRATLKVTDEHGRSASNDVRIVVGNQEPVVEFVAPQGDQAFSWGDPVDFEVAVTDEEEIDCSQVLVHHIVGHDQHGHPQSTTSGCTGTIETTLPQGHAPGETTAVFVAVYTDPGGLTGSAQVALEPAAAE